MIKEKVGYLKYEGSLVDDGTMDARKQAEALLGIDEALRYFIQRESSDFKNSAFIYLTNPINNLL